MNKKNKTGVVQSAVSGGLYGSASPLGKKWISEGPGNYVALDNTVVAGSAYGRGFRELVAVIFVFIQALIMKEKFSPIKKLRTSKAARIVALSGILGGPIAGLASYMAYNFMDSGLIPVFTGLWLIWLVLFTMLINKKRYSRLVWIGIIIMVFGGFFTALFGIDTSEYSSSDTMIAILLAIIVGFAWGIQHALVEWGLEGENNDLTSTESNIYRYGFSSIVFFAIIIPISFAAEGVSLTEALSTFTGVAFMWLLMVGSVAGISNVLYFAGIKKIGAVWSTALYNLYVPMGIFWAWLIMDSEITWEKIVGALIVLAGMSVTQVAMSKRKDNKAA